MNEKFDILEEKTNGMIRCVAIDDDPLFLKTLKIMLEKEEGVELTNAYTNPVEGVMAIVKVKPDVILLDLEMPYLDGLEAIETLDKLPKIIVISGHSTFNNKNLKVDAFIHKPDLAATPHILCEELHKLFV